MTTFSQSDRRLLLSTPLGEDVLLCTSFEGEESLSRPFRFRLALVSENSAISPKDIVAKNITFGIRQHTGDPRYFNGFVRSFSYHGTDDRLSLYSAEIVPWLWFLTRTTDCRIFQSKSIPEILDNIFSDLGFSDYEKQISSTYPKLDYCVQYRESDLDFISRLLEQAGIYYYFRHDNGKHTMVLADSPRGYKDAIENEVAFAPDNLSEVDITDLVTSWEHRYEFRSGRTSHTDYNFQTPSTSLAATARTVVKLDNIDKFERYEYPGLYDKKPDGESIAQTRIEEEQADYETVLAASRCRTFGPGLKFKLTSHHNQAEEGKSYVVTSIRHHAAQPGSFVSGGQMPPEEYTNDFTCIPASVSFRPPRITPKPSVRGCQTAVVVGPAGQEIYTDKFGRIKVQFFWDRLGKKDDNSSCWIRVAQSWAGKNWGSIFLPRISHEVLVDFLDGDPDRPLITGSVYNADNMPPYTLPDEKTKSTIKSNSTIGSGGFNEIRFEDKKDSEQIFIQAEKQMDIRVKKSRYKTIGEDRHLVVEKDKFEHIKNKRNELVDVDHTEEIKNDRNLKVGGKEAIEVAGSHSFKVGKDVIEQFMANHSEVVSKDYYIKADNIVIEGLTNVTLKVGDTYIAIEDAGITLECGQSKIDMKKDGTIDIKGKDITTDATSSATVKGLQLALQGSSKAELKSPTTTVNGDGMLTLKGGMVMIN